MKTLNCDVCKKRLDNPVKDMNYFCLENHDLCEPCRDQLEVVLKPIVRSKSPFSYEWYKRLVIDSVEKAISKGKF